tara:strand:+ start:434 stop:664 length:231 start_codon:yes stop_codon:yes gene_type:complete
MVRQFLFHETTGGAGNPGSPITFMLELGYADANGLRVSARSVVRPVTGTVPLMRSATIGVSRRFIGCIPVRGSGGR